MLEDIVNAAPFTLYPEYMERRQLTADCELAPTIITEYRQGWRRAAEQEQKGAYFNREAVPHSSLRRMNTTGQH